MFVLKELSSHFRKWQVEDVSFLKTCSGIDSPKDKNKILENAVHGEVSAQPLKFEDSGTKDIKPSEAHYEFVDENPKAAGYEGKSNVNSCLANGEVFY